MLEFSKYAVGQVVAQLLLVIKLQCTLSPGLKGKNVGESPKRNGLIMYLLLYPK